MSRMILSPAARSMRYLYTLHAAAARLNLPLSEVRGRHEETRKEALPFSATEYSPSGTPADVAPRIVIVGGGLAGLRCAHELWTGERQVASTVYDADVSHVGGRCWSFRGFFSNGLVGEHGGAFINHDQKAIRRLVARFGLTEEVVEGGDLPVGDQVCWFDDAVYTFDEATEDWGNIGFAAFQKAVRMAPSPQLYNRYTPEGRRLDRLSIPEWLDESGIGSSTRFGRLMMSNAMAEYGGDPEEQSALNLIYLLGSNPQDKLDPMAGYDEKYHVVGGNDQIVTRMLDELPEDTVQQGYRLVALKQRPDRTYVLSFDCEGTSVEVVADHVVLALPFMALQDVDLTDAGLSPRKLAAINGAAIGPNAKIHVELSRKTWPEHGYSGSIYTDWNRFCVAWDDCVSLGAEGGPSLLVAFPAGSTAQNILTGPAHGEAPHQDVTWFLDQVEGLIPGTKAAFTGRAYEDRWSENPLYKGAQSYWRPGQYTSTVGYEMAQEQNLHFAGEHTQWNNQSFLNGAVLSGERAAAEILSQI